SSPTQQFLTIAGLRAGGLLLGSAQVSSGFVLHRGGAPDVRVCIACFLLVLVPMLCAADENPLGISYIETEDLRLIYFDSLGFVTPLSVLTFTNSLAWQKKIFGWDPSQKTTILLKDFSDYGNASALTAPNNRLVLDAAPQSRAFETYPAGERMYTLMNHELVHIATGDVASSEDRSWRSFFFGKVQPTPDQPESLLYSYLTIPRWTAPRWLIEGIA